jgi:hypothetical protein
MVAGTYVNVPEPLSESLVEDGFREVGVQRGIDAGGLLAASANLVTIFVGRHEIARFIAHLWASASRRAPVRRHESMMVIQHDDRRVAITLEHEGFGDEGPPRAVVRGLTSLLEALTEAGGENRLTEGHNERP